MRRTLLGWLPIIAVLPGCAEDRTTDQTGGERTASESSAVALDAAPAREPDAALIGTIRSRRHTVRLYAGDRYSIQDTDGQTIATDLTDRQFAERFPELHEATHEALATDASADQRSAP